VTRRRRLVVLGAVASSAVLVVALVGCNVSQVAWKNASYTVTCPGFPIHPQVVRLVNGHGVASQGGPLYVNLATAITSDVTGDGRADEVLLLGCARQASWYSVEIQVYGDGPVVLARLAAPYLVPSAYFPPQFTGVWVSGGRLHATAEYWAPTDCHFCASIHLAITYGWNGHGFSVLQWVRV